MPQTAKDIYQEEFKANMGPSMLLWTIALMAGAIALVVMVQWSLGYHENFGGPCSILVLVTPLLAAPSAHQAALKKCARLGILERLYSCHVIQRTEHNSVAPDYELWFKTRGKSPSWGVQWLAFWLLCGGLSYILNRFWLFLPLTFSVVMVAFASLMVRSFIHEHRPLVALRRDGVYLELKFIPWPEVAVAEMIRNAGPANASPEQPMVTVRFLNADGREIGKKTFPLLARFSSEDYAALERSLILHLRGDTNSSG